MASVRRMGPKQSETWHALLDAAETVLRDEGYAAASSRRIAEVAGVKQQLVYYYFETMDDLLLAAFKRRTEVALRRLKEDADSDRPVQAIWTDLSAGVDGRLVFEFVALANHHKGIRKEVARFIKQTRPMEAAAIERQTGKKGVSVANVTPTAAAFLLYSLGLMLAREEAMGITEGHDEVQALVRTILKQLR